MLRIPYGNFASIAVVFTILASWFGSPAAADWVELDQSPPGTPAEVVIITESSNDRETTFDLIIHGFWIEEKIGEDQTTYNTITIPGMGTHNQPGAPDLPMLRLKVAIPTNVEEVTLDAVTSSGEQSFTVLVWPQPGPERDHPEGDPEKFIIDTAIYESQGNWPAEHGSSPMQPGLQMRSIPAVTFEGWPCKWEPASRVLTVPQTTRYRLLHSASLRRFGPMTKERFNAAAVEFANWSEVAPYFELNDIYYAGNFLFIYPDGYREELLPLINQKKSRGFWVQEMTTTDTGNTCSGIRSAIQNWDVSIPLERDLYCLLVGDTDEIPLCIDPDNGDPTDDLYASTNGDDQDEEVYLGRLSVDSEADCADQVAKILAYEDNPNLFCCYEEVALWAHDQNAPGKYVGAHESVRTATYSAPPTFVTYYGHQGALDADIRTHINNGLGLVAYRGHGDWNATATDWNPEAEYWDLIDVGLLVNSTRQAPPVWSFACTNNDLDRSDCIGETWMEKFDAGASSYYGATVPSFTDQNHELDRAMFKAVYDLGLVTQSHAIAYAENQMSLNVGTDNAWLYLLLGDPDGKIRRSNPSQLISLHEDALEICGNPPCVFDLQVLNKLNQPVVGAVVAIYKPGSNGNALKGVGYANAAPDEVLENRYTDANGRVSIPFSPQTEGDMVVCVEDEDGNVVCDTVAIVGAPTAALPVPAHNELKQNYPNPFNPTTKIQYSLSETSQLKLSVYDASGRLVRVLVDDVRLAGPGQVTWNGRNENGLAVSSGVYFYRLTAGDFQQIRKMVLLK